MKKVNRKLTSRDAFALAVGVIPALTTFTICNAVSSGWPLSVSLFVTGVVPFSVWPISYVILMKVTNPKMRPANE